MNDNSLLCKLIRDNSSRWQDILDEKRIKYKFGDDNFCIFNYDINADFSDPVVREARGIIIDFDTLDVVCWPFTKFCNIEESFHDEIDWNTAVVEQKVDGSICKLFYNHKQRHWQWATNSEIDAHNNTCNSGRTFYELIHKCENFKDILIGDLNKNCTYIFELTTPENRVVIDYGNVYKLWHLSTRGNITGNEYEGDSIGIERPRVYPLQTLEECKEAVKSLNNRQDNVKAEGFVVHDADYHRVKIKTPEYIVAHKMIANYNFSKKHILEVIHNNAEWIPSIVSEYPFSELYFTYYKYKLVEVKCQMIEALILADRYYEEYDHDRKAVYEKLKDNPHVALAMKYISNNLQLSSQEYVVRFKNWYVKKYKKHYEDKFVEEYKVSLLRKNKIARLEQK